MKPILKINVLLLRARVVSRPFRSSGRCQAQLSSGYSASPGCWRPGKPRRGQASPSRTEPPFSLPPEACWAPALLGLPLLPSGPGARRDRARNPLLPKRR